MALASVAWIAAVQPAAAELPPPIESTFQEIVEQPRYEHSTWGWDVRDVETGEVLARRNAGRQFVPGSIIKDYVAATSLDALGPDHRFSTPVYRRGGVDHGKLRGDLVLVGDGDFSFGLRNRPDDTLAFTNFDHNEAGTLPFAQLVKGNPLAGLKQLATDVARSGIKTVTGNVVVDNRLFRPYKDWPDGRIDSIWVNENLLDIKVWPTSPGQRAKVGWRPHTPAYRVVSRVRTTRPGSGTDLSVENAGHGTVEVHGTIAADAGRQLQKFVIPDPARFARTAFIQALRREGVRVQARARAANRRRLLPARGHYRPVSRVASFGSPPLSEYVKVVLKVSYNRGAQLFGCLVAVHHGSRDCNDAADAMTDTITPLGVSPDSTFLFDPAGSIDDARTSPTDMAEFHRRALEQPYGAALEAGLPVLGRDGSLATTLVDSPAAGHVFGKTGTRVTTTPNGRTLLLAQNLVGYIDTKSGRKLSYAFMVNDVRMKAFEDVIEIFADEGKLGEALQQGL